MKRRPTSPAPAPLLAALCATAASAQPHSTAPNFRCANGASRRARFSTCTTRRCPSASRSRHRRARPASSPTVLVDDLGFGVTSTFGGPAQEPMTGRSLPASLDDPNARTRSARHFEIAEPKALFVQEAEKCIVLPLDDRVAERMDAVGALRVGDNVHVRHTEAVALSVSKP